MAIAAFAILSALVFLLSGGQGFFVKRTPLVTYLDDSAAIAPAAPVRLNGILVGEVSSVELSGSSDPDRIVRVTMDVNDAYLSAIPVDSEASIAAETLLATKYINIKKGQAPQTVQAGAEIRARQTGDFNDVIEQGNSTLQSLQGVFSKADGVIANIEAGNGTIGKLLVDETLYRQLLSITDEVKTLTASINEGKGTIGKLMQDPQLYDDVRGTIARTNTILDDVEQGQGTLGQLIKNPALYNETRETIGDVRTLLADLNAGKGTAGKLLKSEELHDEVRETISKLDTLLAKINNGEGTIGQLMVNPSLYDSLDSTSREINGLIKDFRANPKKFLRIKLALF